MGRSERAKSVVSVDYGFSETSRWYAREPRLRKRKWYQLWKPKYEVIGYRTFYEDKACEICGADPMTVDCNNANCDTRKDR